MEVSKDLNSCYRQACVFQPGVVFALLLAAPVMNAQDTTTLKEVDVVVEKTERLACGKKLQELDSSLLSLYRYKSLSDLLSENSGMFIKNYGPGALSSTALRGGSAYHTALLWNGFNIQNPMLGQSDLSSLPVFLFDKAGIEYGGSSALWGSGAVSGSILLRNSSPFNAGTNFLLNVNTNSFGTANVGLAAMYSKKNWVISTKIYGNHSNNTYKFKDDSGTVYTQHQAAYRFLGLLQEIKFITGKKSTLALNAWLNNNERQIPSTDPSVVSKTYQFDKALRASLSWNYTGLRLQSVIRGAGFLEQINYTDSSIALFSKSESKTMILENENFFNYHPLHRLHFGLNSTISSAVADNYAGQQGVNRLSVLLGHRSLLFHKRLQASASLRMEYFSAAALPVTGNLALDYFVLPQLKFQANAARVYRQPTLNELYWQPGGNPQLLPEEGYTFELGAVYNHSIKRYTIAIGGSAYSRHITNWVVWVPGPMSVSSPQNIQEVWSRGTETDWQIKYSNKEFGWQLTLHSTYVLSTILETQQPNSDTKNKQLIYTPRYLFVASAKVWYESTSLSFMQQYTGYRFTSSDNLQWLDPYHLSSIRMNYSYPQNSLNLVIFLACNNVFNANYQVVEGRAMPLRNFEVGISVLTNSQKKNTTKNQNP